VSAQLLIADSDPVFQRSLHDALTRDDSSVTSVATGLDALAVIFRDRIDLAIIEADLPDISGFAVCRRVRMNRTLARLPILICSRRAREQDRIAGLEAGADDYVSKPVSVRELCLRVRAVLRRVPARPHACVETGGVQLNLDAHRCQVHGRDVQLTVREFALLRVLLQRPGRAHTREALLAEVWGSTDRAGLRTVDAHISRLRNKLGGSGMQIQTVRGSGYRFVSSDLRSPDLQSPDLQGPGLESPDLGRAGLESPGAESPSPESRATPPAC